MKRIVFVLGMILLTFMCYGQQEISEITINAPRYSGNIENIANRNEKVAPIEQFLLYRIGQMVEEDGEFYNEGTVVVDFTVLTDGHIKDIEIKNSVSSVNDQAVVAGIMETDGDWSAGMKNGENVEMVKRVVIAFDNPDSPSLERKAIACYRQGVKRYYRADGYSNQYFSSAEKLERKMNRKFHGALRSFAHATVYKPNDASILFWQARTCEKLGDYAGQLRYQNLFDNLFSFESGMENIHVIAIAL